VIKNKLSEFIGHRGTILQEEEKMMLKKSALRFFVASVMALSLLAQVGCGSDSADSQSSTPTTTFMYTSDAHYGINRGAATNGLSTAVQVNGALIEVMNGMNSVALPADGGVNSKKLVSSVDFTVNTGDIASRSEGTEPANVVSDILWTQFAADYLTKLNLTTTSGTKAPVYLTPGNHDDSNAFGYYKGNMNWNTIAGGSGNTSGLDDTSYVKIYNAMMNPATLLTKGAITGANYTTTATNYASKRVVTSKRVNDVLYVFIGIWPDSTNRTLIDAEIAKAPANTPVILFTHDQPDIETKHLTNPSTTNTGNNAINATDKFENLASDAPDSASAKGTSINAQAALTTWLSSRKNIVAYFHGNDNRNEFYTWTGQPAGTISLPVFRVDSPMKGTVSGNDAADEMGDPTKLSFQVVSVDFDSKLLTAREYLWNTKAWGTSVTTSLNPRVK
jgi:hypothetical protein